MAWIGSFTRLLLGSLQSLRSLVFTFVVERKRNQPSFRSSSRFLAVS